MSVTKIKVGSSWVAKPVKFGAPNWRTKTTTPPPTTTFGIVGSQLSTATSGGGLNVDMPSGIVPGERLLMVLGYFGLRNPETVPTGWTLVQAQNPTNNGAVISAYTKLATGTETTTSVLGFTSTSDPRCGVVYRIAGAGALHASARAGSVTRETSSSMVHVAPSVTTSVSGCLILRFVATQTTPQPLTYGWPGSLTKVADYTAAASGYHTTLAAASAVQIGQGATGDVNATGVASSSTSSYGYSGLTVAVAPA